MHRVRLPLILYRLAVLPLPKARLPDLERHWLAERLHTWADPQRGTQCGDEKRVGPC